MYLLQGVVNNDNIMYKTYEAVVRYNVTKISKHNGKNNYNHSIHCVYINLIGIIL